MKTFRIFFLAALVGSISLNSFCMKRTLTENADDSNSSSSNIAQQGFFIGMPVELLVKIISLLPDSQSFGVFARLCKHFKELCYTMPPESFVYINILEIIKNPTYKQFFETTFLNYINNSRNCALDLAIALIKKNHEIALYRFQDGSTPYILAQAKDDKNLFQFMNSILHLCTSECCVKAFAQKDALDEHMRKHSGKNIYLCTYENCTKVFSGQGALQRHMKFHTVEKPYKCPHEGCDRAFVQRSDLQRHMRTNHN